MLLPRLPVLSALLLFLLPAALLRGPGARAEGRVDGRSLLELVSRDPRTRAETAAGLGGVRALERGARSHHGPEGHPKDPQYKKKFLMYLTGPLSFHPKCRKQFHRLYHNTRDCTEPGYYKRCARLLTQLAKSPRCTER